MKKNISKVIFLIFTLMIATTLVAQNKDLRKITAKVTDEFNNPIPGALVLAKEGAVKTTTALSGEFSIMSKLNDVIRVEADGYETAIVIASVINTDQTLILKESVYKRGEKDLVNLSFGKQYKRNTVGNISYLNADNIHRQEPGRIATISSIDGRLPGVFGSLNVLGFGNAIVVVDGVPRSFYDVNLQEVEQISVLKDATSKMLYGAYADRGIVMITTKRGIPYHRKMNVYAESSLSMPKSLPKYLNSADYMELYNESLTNDGLSPLYSQSSIDKTRAGISPLVDKEAFANEDYYNSRYLNDFTNSQKINIDASGGNNVAQYYTTIGWQTGTKLINMGEEEGSRNNRINVRGNVNYKINDFIKARLDVFSVFNIEKGANTDFWQLASTLKPNYYPLLIPDSLLSLSMRNAAQKVNGNYVLGGTSMYSTNIFGELNNKGYSSYSEYVIQMNSGLDFDLSFITKGLTSSFLFSYDSWSQARQFQDNTYAIYEPIWVAGTLGDSLTFTKTNTDDLTGTLSITDEMAYRQFSYYATLDYQRVFNQIHNISATANFYYGNVQNPGVFFPDKNLTIGQRVSYSYDNKYLAEFAGAMVGSGKLPIKNRYKYAPSFGLGWIVSEEDFLNGNATVDYLKFRVSAGNIYTDNGIDDYYLYNTSFEQNGNFNYNDGTNVNTRLRLSSAGNPDLDWLKRTEYQIGFDALLFKSLALEGGYFYRKREGELTQLNNTNPSYLGATLPFQNFNSYQNQGVEFGLNYSKKWGDLSANIGYNMVYSVPKTLKLEEPNYAYDARIRTGKATDTQFGLVADGLYQPTDFATIDYATQTFVLNPGVVSSTYGAVQPGDIKYVDQTGDNIINDDDQTPIGNSSARFQHGINIEIGYKNFQFFALGTAQTGQTIYYSNNYYQLYGDLKYSDQALDRYHITNNPTGSYPRLSSKASQNSHNFKNSSFWLYKNDWFNLQTVQMAYSLSQRNVEKLKMEKLRIYLRGSNLLLISDIREKRELNIGSAPQMRSVTIGFNATF